jgi:hypothetical protein
MKNNRWMPLLLLHLLWQHRYKILIILTVGIVVFAVMKITDNTGEAKFKEYFERYNLSSQFCTDKGYSDVDSVFIGNESKYYCRRIDKNGKTEVIQAPY